MKAHHYYYVFLLFLFNIFIVHALPIFPSSSSASFSIISSTILSTTLSKEQQPHTTIAQLILEEEDEDEEEEDYTPIETITKQEDDDKCPTTEYGIPVERFAQLVSTHWHFDHLDSIKSGTYKVISEQFQEHIQISIEPISKEEDIDPSYNTRQRTFTSMSNNKWDMMMDLEILHAQIFGAIQAHTEGSLHIAWDQLSDKLGQPAFEQFIRSVALNHCTLDKEQNLLSSTCLKEKASAISLELDDYIHINLNRVFLALENNILPNLLSNTSKDLKGVLDYFNRLFLLKDHQRLLLQVSPWSSEHSDLQSKLQPLLEKSVDEHLGAFFEDYACLSR